MIIKSPNGAKFAVDDFTSTYESVSFFFLTHFHCNQYSGLNKDFDGKVVCGEVTSDLIHCVISQEIRVLVVTPNRPIVLEDVEITSFDANHCVGSFMFVFKTKSGSSILYTGDFRWNATMEESYTLINSLSFDHVYIDTTYCNRDFLFPTQHDVIVKCLSLIKSFIQLISCTKTDLLILIGAYMVGRERLVSAISKNFKSNVYAQSKLKRDILKITLKSDEDFSDVQSNVHVIPMRVMNYDSNLTQYLAMITKKVTSVGRRFKHVLLVSPPSNPRKMAGSTPNHSLTSMEIKKKSSTNKKCTEKSIFTLEIPYSDHSSFVELERFVKTLHLKNGATASLHSTNDQYYETHEDMRVRHNGLLLKSTFAKWLSEPYHQSSSEVKLY